MSRGYLSSSCYLIDVEAGFELWQGGAGLATNSFSVNVGGSVTGSPSPSPSTSSSAPASACTAAYSVVSSWPGGFQGQVTLTNAGSAAVNGWTAEWTFPGNQQIGSLWNGVATQSGAQVTVTNEPYDATIAPGSSVTLGFTATGTAAAPASVSCT